MNTANSFPMVCSGCGSPILDASFIWNGSAMYHTHCRPPSYVVATPALPALTADDVRRIVREELERARGVAPSERPRKSLNAMAADLLRPYLKPGQKVIWREAFRWHDDNGVLSNHYDGMELPALAEDFGYDWEYDFDFKHAAIVWKKGGAAGVQGTLKETGNG
jgi:hypothetical protein